ncbi:hypothetical protein P3X46_007166, partial [Hevea brasiliensis]
FPIESNSFKILANNEEYIYFGDRSSVCLQRDALYWEEECVQKLSKQKYTLRCKDGKISLPLGPPVFKISGQVHYLMGSLITFKGDIPKFAQLYVYDTKHKVQNRMITLQGKKSDFELDPNIIKILIQMFDEISQLVKLFRAVKDRFQTNEKIPLKWKLLARRKEDSSQYEKPTSNDIGGLIVGDIGEDQTSRDIVVEFQSEDGFRIDISWNQSYYGEKPHRKRISMRSFYCFQLQEGLIGGNTIFKGGKLFQQYLTRFHKKKKNLRSEIYKGIQDAIVRCDNGANTLGQKIILPSTYMGSPRYMFQNYQDAMTICRNYGNPVLFVTFTWNPKWIEITKALRTIQGQKVQDRPDLIVKVFAMKLNYMLIFIKTGAVFGPIIAEIPDKNFDPLGYEVVAEYMMHGPCGPVKMDLACMKNAICLKKFPKQFKNEIVIEDNGFISYKRRDNNNYVVRDGIKTLCVKYQAHINVEICSQSMLIKYLFKYLTKGLDRIRMVIEENIIINDSETSYRQIDEIKAYLNCRYICPHEAAWRIFAFPLHHRNLAILRMSVHLPMMHNIAFDQNQTFHSIFNKPGWEKTIHLTYNQFLREWTWNHKDKQWTPGIGGNTIGRIYYIHPNAGELYYLIKLLKYVKGATCYEDLRTINNILYPSFQEACEALELLGDDREWDEGLKETTQCATSSQLRHLFTIILLVSSMSNDIVIRLKNLYNNPDFQIPTHELQNYVLYELEKLLNASSTSLTSFKLPLTSTFLLQELNNRLLGEELNYNMVKLKIEHNQLVRSNGQIVLVVASSKIASLLLPGDQTSICKIKKGIQSAKLIEKTSLILWDEVPMNDKFSFEALDKSLNDLFDNDSIPFGGMPIVLGDDFRQILPVKLEGSKDHIIDASISNSYLWSKCKIYILRENMRLTRNFGYPLKITIEQFINVFVVDWLSKKYENVMKFRLIAFSIQDENDEDTTCIKIPSKYILEHRSDPINSILVAIYDNFQDNYQNVHYLKERAIGCDFLCLTSGNLEKLSILYPTEFLNTLNFNGLSPHELKLKVGSPIMLLRNINQAVGLCNGTRLIITQLTNKIIKEKNITSSHEGEKVYIPRIEMSAQESRWPFVMKRRQFPVKVCYTMTINKSQGQSLNKVGLYLDDHVFTHNQLYVTLSRVTCPNELKVLILPSATRYEDCVKNIVYHEILDTLTAN